MSKLPIIDSKKLLRILLRMGFLEVRSKGSHLQLKKGNLLVTVPMHKKDIKPETLKSILRQAKINLEDLENYL